MYRQSGKNVLNSNTFSTCSDNMVNFGPLVAEICLPVWRTPANFNGFRVLAALLHGLVGVSQSLRHWTEGATYIRQGGHHVGHWPTLYFVYKNGCSCRILIQNEQLAQMNTFPYLGSVITEDGECKTEFRNRLNRGQTIAASLQKIWKSHSIPISTKIRVMKALVWPSCRHVGYGCES